MELIPINDSKLKIMLSYEDMTYYKLDADNISYSDEETRNALKAIFKDVKVRSGFDADTQKTYIQLYPDKHGGCEMFVTKLECDKGGIHKPSTKAIKGAIHAKENFVFSFDSIEHLIKVCRRLDKCALKIQSSVYKDTNGKRYFLIIYGVNQLSFFTLDEFSFIGEFAKRQNSEYSWLYIKEHCDEICAMDAIPLLAAF